MKVVLECEYLQNLAILHTDTNMKIAFELDDLGYYRLGSKVFVFCDIELSQNDRGDSLLELRLPGDAKLSSPLMMTKERAAICNQEFIRELELFGIPTV